VPADSAASHPLDPLTADEIRTAVSVLRSAGIAGPQARFADVELWEPAKGDVQAFRAGDPIERRVRARLVTGSELAVVEAVVSVTAEKVVSVDEVAGVCPTLLIEESINAAEAVRADPRWQVAMRRRGITDFAHVEVDPWAAGRFGLPEEEGRRLARAISYVREQPEDNSYARPIEGVVALVDLGTAEVLGVDDHGIVAVPADPGRYKSGHVGPVREGLRPLEIVQPEGPSFTLEGNMLSWQRWSMRVSLNPHEGIVLHQVGYEDGGRVRPILYRASVTEMVVPYGEPGPMHGWKNALDAAEWGLGKMANSLQLGCDCLGEIRYLDAAMAGERGDPYNVRNAICIHEEDHGIGWKHVDLLAGLAEVRRSRRLVVSSIVTAGNYDYGFYWYFYLDGTIELEVKLTGIVTTIALDPSRQDEVPAEVAPTAVGSHATRITPELAAPNHQHLFSARLDLDVDGAANSVYEVDVRADDDGPGNPWGNAFAAHATLLEDEQSARRTINPAASRVWKIVNPSRHNAAGDPVGYKLVPGATPTLLARADSSIGRRAGFATANLWVTPYAPGERWAAGEYPNQHPGGDGLPRWTAANRPIAGSDVVVWYTFGVTHIVRPEEWPVMPVESTGFTLVPAGFFDRNPALDLPPPAVCQE
jgi:primary-amine oxidase